MKPFNNFIMTLILMGSFVLSGCGKNNDQQVVPTYPLPGNAVYNCLPGQPCGYGTNILTNNLSAPLQFSGTISLNGSSRTNDMIKAMRSYQRELNTGYAISFCLGCGGSANNSTGIIQMTADQSQGQALFHVIMVLGSTNIYDSSSYYPSGATIVANALLYNTQKGTGSQLQFRDPRFPAFKFNLVSDSSKLDGSASNVPVQLIVNDDYASPAGTMNLTTYSSYGGFGF